MADVYSLPGEPDLVAPTDNQLVELMASAFRKELGEDLDRFGWSLEAQQARRILIGYRILQRYRK